MLMQQFSVGSANVTSETGSSEHLKLANDVKETLGLHNKYRCMHGGPLMVWDDDVAKNAQKWADKGKFEHSSSRDRFINGEQCGENLAWASPSCSAEKAVKMWYDEIKYTKPYGEVKSFSGQTGHYTQVVWKASVKLGCGVGPKKGSGGDMWVCQYCVAGNMQGEFEENVVAPTLTEAECEGSSPDDSSPDDSSPDVTTTAAPSPYTLSALGASECPQGTSGIATSRKCREAASAMNMKFKIPVESEKMPGGCVVFKKDRVFFNSATDGAGHNRLQLICNV